MLLETPIPFRYIFNKVRREVVAVLVITVAVESLIGVKRGYVPIVPVGVPAFLGTAISLILSFKLNQSYDRWWEARKVWGAIVNDSRTLVRQALTFTARPFPEGPSDIVVRLARRQIAWCYCLGQALRGNDWTEGSAPYLVEEERRELEGHANKAAALLSFHARDVAELAHQGHLSDYRRVQMDNTLSRLTDWMGMAERINNTVFPRTYRLFLHASIYLFITLLSISLSDVEGGWQVAITTAISLPFFLLERTATHMQDPFRDRPTDTPVTSIARTIEINVLQSLGETNVPPPLPADGFYLR